MSKADPPPTVRDYQRSRAVLMGTWEYSDSELPSIPAARFSLERLREVLSGPLCGWPEERVTVLRDEQEPGNLADRLVGLFEDVSDVALFYYVGHGQPDESDQLCLGLGHTSSKANRRYNTSLPFDAVRRALAGSPAATKIVILDCCYAGLATEGANTLGPAGELAAVRLDVKGAYTMCAASRSAKAMCETDGEAPQTYFTKYLADAIETGSPDGPVTLSLRSLFETARDRLALAGHPTPHDRISGDAYKFEFAYNAVRTADRALDVREQIERMRDRSAVLLKSITAMVSVIEGEPEWLAQSHGRQDSLEQEHAMLTDLCHALEQVVKAVSIAVQKSVSTGPVAEWEATTAA